MSVLAPSVCYVYVVFTFVMSGSVVLEDKEKDLIYLVLS